MSAKDYVLFRVERVTTASGEVVGALVPRFATDRRVMRERGYKIGDDLRALLSKPRILGQHRKAHLLGQLVKAQIEGFEHESSHSAIKRLQRESGVCCVKSEVDASPISSAILEALRKQLGDAVTDMVGVALKSIETVELTEAQSLAFDKMDTADFELFYGGICAHIASAYWPSLNAEQVEEMAELFDREQDR